MILLEWRSELRFFCGLIACGSICALSGANVLFSISEGSILNFDLAVWTGDFSEARELVATCFEPDTPDGLLDRRSDCCRIGG